MAKVTIKRTDLENMINESIQKYFDKINEISTALKGAAAMRAAKNAKDEKNPSWKKQKYQNQARRLSRAAANDGARELGVKDAYFYPETGDMGGKFDASLSQASADITGGDKRINKYYQGNEQVTSKDFYPYLLDKDLRRYGKAEDGINNYYDKAQKYKTDINSELEENKSKKKELNENSIRAIVAEALKQVLSQRLNEEMDEFKPHGYCCDSNWGGKEIEISDSGDAARIRTNYGDGPSKPSEWCEIQYDFQDEDGNDMDDGRPYILVNGEKEYLDNYMRYI